MSTTGLYASLTVAQLQSKLVELGIKFATRERKAALLERYRQAVEATEPPAPSAVNAAGACTSSVSSPPGALLTSPSPVKVKEDEEEHRKEVEGTPCSTTIPASTGTESGSELEPPFKRARQGSPSREGEDEIEAEEAQQRKQTGDDRGEDEEHKVARLEGAKWTSEDEDMPAAPQAPCHRAMPPGSAPVTPQPLQSATEVLTPPPASGSFAKGHGSMPGTPPVGGSPTQVKQNTDSKEAVPEAPKTPVASPGAAACSPEGSPVARAAWATEQAGKASGGAAGLVGSPERTPERNPQTQSELGGGHQWSPTPGEPEASKVLDMDSNMVKEKEDLGKKVITQEDSKDVQEKEGKMMKKDNKRRPVEPKLNREVKEKEAAKKEKEETVSKDEESKDTEEPAWKKARHEKSYSSTGDSWQTWNSGWEESKSTSSGSSWNRGDNKKWHSWQDWSEESTATKEPEWTSDDHNKDTKDADWGSKSWRWDDNNQSSSSSSWDEKRSWREKHDDWGGSTSKWSSDERWQGSDESVSWEDCRKNEHDQDESSWKSGWGKGEAKEQHEGSQDTKEGSSGESTSWEGSWSSWTQDETEWSGGSSGSSHTAESGSSSKGTAGDAWSWFAGKGAWPPRPPPPSMRMSGGQQMHRIIGQFGRYGWPPSPQDLLAAAWWGSMRPGRIVPPPQHRRPPMRPPQRSLPSRPPVAEERAAAEPLPAAADLGGASGSTEQVAATSPAEGAAPEHAPGSLAVTCNSPAADEVAMASPGQELMPQCAAAPEPAPSGCMSEGSPESTSDARTQPADPRAAFAKYGFPQFLKQWQQWQDVIFAGWPALPAGWVRCFSKTRDTVYFTRVRDLFTTFEESEVVPDVEQSQS